MQSTRSSHRVGPRTLILPLTALAAVVFMWPDLAEGTARPTAKNRYIGAGKCKNCHSDKASGDQHAMWLTTRHAGAYATLASDQAREYGAKRGVANPQESDKCMRCHATAWSEPETERKKGFDLTQGVQCETCHGPGEQHMKARFAAAASQASAVAYQEVPADEIIRQPPMQICLTCHNEESPGFKPFCFHQARHKIQHLNPRKPRTAEDQKALRTCGCGDACQCVHGCEEKCGVPSSG